MKLVELEKQRASYTPERQSYYRDCRLRCPKIGPVLGGNLSAGHAGQR